MAKLVVLYQAPKDAADFERRYFETHVPLTKKIPGLRKFEVSRRCVMTPAGPSPLHLVAMLHFDDMAAIQAAFGSAEGQAAVEDAKTLSSFEVLMFDSEEV
jgi:uncharacterized protein (TIGR02118 family)